MAARPTVGRRAVEVLLETELSAGSEKRLLLVDAEFEGGDQDREFTVKTDTGSRHVVISSQSSPLGVSDAWQHHRAEHRDDNSVLVVTGGVPAGQLGWDVRAHAVRQRPLGINRIDIVKQLFGATDLDARMVGEAWLLDALLEAEPVDGWPRGGTVLTRDRAVQALIAARLGLGDIRADSLDLDADALFAWSRSTAGPALFAALPATERNGLGDWLGKTVGPAAPTLLALAADGRGRDALPLGVLASAALSSQSAEAAGFALGTLFGNALSSFAALGPFSEAATGVVTRWIAQAESGGPHHGDARNRVLTVLERADQLAADSRLAELIGADRLLPSGYRARLQALSDALHGRAAHAEAALRVLEDHHLATLTADSTDRAHIAVRLVRWLNTPKTQVDSVPQAVQDHIASTAWADLAVGVLAEGDTSRDAALSDSYHRLIGKVRKRRDLMDEEFARALALWTEGACQQAPGGALLIEDVLGEAAAALARDGGRPLILILDGMSADVAVDLADGLDRRVWTEVVSKPGARREASRQAAVSMFPSVTRISRTSLLCGKATEGGQSVERSGFESFWKKRRREAQLFHKGTFEGLPGHRLSPELVQALASDDVVGVILNTIDDALDDGRESARGRWRIGDIAKLPDLLNAARDHGRPVLLVSDHGHVLDRTPRNCPRPVVDNAGGSGGDRWRTGTAGDGEVELTGPRVLTPGGRVTLPWREELRYASRKAGYHGGASLAETVVPVIALVPAEGPVPSGWTLLPTERTHPSWWLGSRTRSVAEDLPPAGRSTAQDPGMFPVPGQGTLGERTVQSDAYAAQREFVRLAPPEKAVAAVIDALAQAGGKLSPAAVTAAAQSATGRSQRNPERFATVLERLLNVDGYAVLRLVESGRTVQLDKALLEQQFLGDTP
ncbi:BREX-2 system phosphatase PglZ [Streptomyces sp. NPDC046465]|uniref:BREX-2 system phosphatase PglZ n=1 Tax=Streptomyces sp. NPDC046465 TaxID=3155810 RepID=UPI0033E8701D